MGKERRGVRTAEEGEKGEEECAPNSGLHLVGVRPTYHENLLYACEREALECPVQ